jgi:hypothetical protein
MKRLLQLTCLIAAGLVACSDRPAEPAKLSDQEKEVVRIARKAISQFDDWADRAEFKIERRGSEWHVTAWRVEHPAEKGNRRYVPWGRREIVIDDAGKVVSYANSK